MPLPIAHGLIGASLVALVHPQADAKNWKPLLLGFVLANLPDLDFAASILFKSDKFHRGITHSLLSALIVGAIFFVVLRHKNWCVPAAYSLAFLSHTLLDAVAGSGGVRLLSPFNNNFYALNLFSLSELSRGFLIADMLRFTILEALIFIPLFLFVLLVKKLI